MIKLCITTWAKSPILVLYVNVAKCISTQSLSKTNLLIIFFDPFQTEQSIIDITTIFSKLLYILSLGSSLDCKTLSIKIQLEIIGNRNFQMDESLIQEQCFDIYNRLPSILDSHTHLKAPAYAIEPQNLEPKFSIDYPLLGSPLLLLEPDRIIHLSYGTAGGFLVMKWCDSYGEYEHTKFMNVPDSIPSEIYRRTLNMFGTRGFFIRLVIDNQNGWTKNDIKGIYY